MNLYKLIILFCCLFFGENVRGQIITLYAGSGSSLGDGGPATNASLLNPSKGAFDKYGNFYIASNLGNRIRKIDISGNITTIAGTGTAGYNGDGILATTAMLKHPTSIAFDTADNLYICEHDGARVRKIDKITGIISTVAGNGILAAGIDGIPATSSALNDPQDICFDKYGNLYVAEYFSSKVRKISPTGIISTFAGNGIAGYSGDGGLADTSSIGGIVGLCSDTTGNIYLADVGNSRIFKVNTGGIITTVAGTNAGISYNGDNIPATTANIDPYDVEVDDTGNLIIADNQNHIVRKVDQLGIIHTIAGNGINGSAGDGGPAIAAQLSKSIGLAFDACGNLYISDANTARVRKVWFAGMATPPVATITPTPNDTVCMGSTVTLAVAASGADSIVSYNWYVNGTLITGATNATYSYTPANGDTVNCSVQSLVDCNGAFTVTSNTVHITTIANGIPTISLNGLSTAAPGATVTITATVSGAGGSYLIRWMNHGSVFATTSVPSVSYVKGASTDTITARIVPAGGCYDSVTAAGHIVNVDHTSIGNVNTTRLNIFPNPVQGVLHVNGIGVNAIYTLLEVTGRQVMNGALQAGDNELCIEGLSKGVYLLQVQYGSGERVVHRVVKE